MVATRLCRPEPRSFRLFFIFALSFGANFGAPPIVAVAKLARRRVVRDVTRRDVTRGKRATEPHMLRRDLRMIKLHAPKIFLRVFTLQKGFKQLFEIDIEKEKKSFQRPNLTQMHPNSISFLTRQKFHATSRLFSPGPFNLREVIK